MPSKFNNKIQLYIDELNDLTSQYSIDPRHTIKISNKKAFKLFTNKQRECMSLATAGTMLGLFSSGWFFDAKSKTQDAKFLNFAKITLY